MASLHVHYEYEDGSANTIHPTSVTYPDGRVLTYNYGTTGGMNDRLSRVESLGFDGTGNLVQPAYLGLGTQVRTTMSEPQVRWDLATGSSPNPYAGLDRFGRVIDNKWTNYNTSATLDQIKYTYDRASNRVSRENVVAKAQTTPKYFDELYGYDGSNRLTLMERGQLAGSPPSSITNKQFAQDWGLDPTGNWKGFKENATGGVSWTLNQTRTSNPVNEIIAINESLGEPSWVTPGYDSAGNMTTIPRPAEPTGDFTGVYDAWNRLVELRGLDDTVVARYEYDGLTRRVVKHTFPGWEELEAADWDALTQEDWNGLQLTQAHRRDYYYNSSWQILEERVENDTVFDRQYVWGLRYIDGLVFRDRQLTSSVERNYALQDANWNVTALTDVNGAVVERYSYSAYGVSSFLNPDFTPADNNEAYDWDVLYAGYKWDSESALYQVRYRYLQPALGTWVSRDPIGYGAGSLNLILYCNSRPINFIDSLGLDEERGRYHVQLKQDTVGPEGGNLTRSYANIKWYPHSTEGSQTKCPCKIVQLFQIARTIEGWKEILGMFGGTNIKDWHIDYELHTQHKINGSEAYVIYDTSATSKDRDEKGRDSLALIIDQPGFTTLGNFMHRWVALYQDFETGAVCLDKGSGDYGKYYGTVYWGHSFVIDAFKWVEWPGATGQFALTAVKDGGTSSGTKTIWATLNNYSSLDKPADIVAKTSLLSYQGSSYPDRKEGNELTNKGLKELQGPSGRRSLIFEKVVSAHLGFEINPK